MMPKSQKQIDDEILRAQAIAVQMVEELKNLRASEGHSCSLVCCAAINAVKMMAAEDGVSPRGFAEWLEDIALETRRQAGLPHREY